MQTDAAFLCVRPLGEVTKEAESEARGRAREEAREGTAERSVAWSRDAPIEGAARASSAIVIAHPLNDGHPGRQVFCFCKDHRRDCYCKVTMRAHRFFDSNIDHTNSGPFAPRLHKGSTRSSLHIPAFNHNLS